MRITINSGDHRLWIPVPMFFLSRPMVKLGLRMIRCSGKYVSLPEQASSVWDLPEEKILMLCDELRKVKKLHKHWPLVEVESAEGDLVKIIL